jgi:hypothetical protein
LRDYRGSDDAPLLGRSVDPWNEDLFYRRLPVPPPVLSPEKDQSKNGASPEAMLGDPHENPLGDDPRARARFGDARFDEPDVRALAPAFRSVIRFKVLIGVLAALLFSPPKFGYVSGQRKNQKTRSGRRRRAKTYHEPIRPFASPIDERRAV